MHQETQMVNAHAMLDFRWTLTATASLFRATILARPASVLRERTVCSAKQTLSNFQLMTASVSVAISWTQTATATNATSGVITATTEISTHASPVSKMQSETTTEPAAAFQDCSSISMVTVST